jgi:hypothetical protein
LNSSFSSIFSKEQGSFREGRRPRRRTLHLHRWQVAETAPEVRESVRLPLVTQGPLVLGRLRRPTAAPVVNLCPPWQRAEGRGQRAPFVFVNSCPALTQVEGGLRTLLYLLDCPQLDGSWIK